MNETSINGFYPIDKLPISISEVVQKIKNLVYGELEDGNFWRSVVLVNSIDDIRDVRATLLSILRKRDFLNIDWYMFGKSSERRLILTAAIEAIYCGHGQNTLGGLRSHYKGVEWLEQDVMKIEQMNELTKEITMSTTSQTPQYAFALNTNNDGVSVGNKYFSLSKSAIEEVTFFFGVEGSTVTNEHVYAVIEALEKRIELLKRIKNKPDSLREEIKELKAKIDEALKFANARFHNVSLQAIKNLGEANDK